MRLTLVNFQTQEEICLNAENPVIVGRGSLLRCADKKVSRNHGKIQLTPEGNVCLVALHTNPCFFMKNGLPPVVQLAKGEEQVLKNGDYIGLLPDSFWYKIVMENCDTENYMKFTLNSSNDIKEFEPLKGVILEGNTKPTSTQEAIGSESDKTFECDVSKMANTTETNEEQRNLEDASDTPQPVDPSYTCLTERLKALEKTKKLPIWMYEIDDFPGKIKQANLQEKLSHPLQVDETQFPISGIKESGEHNKEDLPAVNSAIDNYLDEIHCETSNEIKHEKLSNVKEEYVKIEESLVESVADSSKANVIELKGCNAENSNNSNVNSSHSRKRPMCQYEEKCYRKNEEHRKELCHPGDPDFVPYEKRAKCQYGASCYRRSKAHHVEYQHPQLIRPKGNASTESPMRKRQKKKETCYRDTSEEDYYDLEDPFINDGSSDEFIPSDFDSDDDIDDDC